MAHFAKIENGIVTTVVVVDNEHESYGQQYLNDLGLDGTWIQTSYNANFGKKFAGIGDEFDGTNFRPQKPQEDAMWNEETWSWDIPAISE